VAATLTGTFRLIDRASGDLKKMAAQAALTDAAFEKLGARMDIVGSRQKAQGIERTARATRGLGQETDLAGRRMDRYDRSVRSADRSTAGFGGRIRTVLRGLKDFGGELFKLARPAGMIVGFGTAIGLVGQAVGALAGGIVALGPRLVDLTGLLAPAIAGAAGLATTFLSLKTAFTQLSTAMKGGEAGQKAFREMGKAGQQVVSDLKGLRPVMLELRQAASGGIFTGLHQSLMDMRRVLPSLEPMLRRYSAMIGGELARGSARLTAPGFMGDIRNIMGQGIGTSRTMIRGLLNIVSALRHVAVAARPFTEWLSRTVLGWTQFADQAARAGRQSGRLEAFFERTRKAAEGLGGMVKDLWITLRNIGSAARPLGEELFTAMQKTARGWAQITGRPETRLRLMRDFNAMAAGLKAMANLAGALGAAIFRMGAGGGLARTATALQGMVGPLERLLTYFADTFGPPMARALVDLTKLLENMGGAAGPLVTILNVVDGIFRGLNAIIGLIGPFKGFVATLVGGLLTARLLQKIGLLSIAWRSVTVEATRAGAAQVAAMGAGRAGIGLGPLLGGGRGGAAGRGRGWLGSFWRGGRAGPGAPGMPGGPAGPVAPAVGRGAMLRGVGGGLARGAGRLAGGFALPILGMQAAFGAATTPGGAGERAWGGARAAGLGGNPWVSTLSGAAIGAGIGAFGGPIGLGIGAGIGAGVGWGASALAPGPGAGEAVIGASRQRLEAGMQASAGATGVGRMNREIAVMRAQLRSISYLNTESAKKYRAQLQSEITARTQLVAQLNAEERMRGRERGAKVTENLAQMYDALKKKGVPEAEAQRQTVQAGLEQIRMTRGRGARAQALRGEIGRGLLRATRGGPAYGQVAAAIEQADPGVVVRGTSIYRGGRPERAGILGDLELPTGLRAARGRAALTPRELDLVANLEASGMSRSQALSMVRQNSGRPRALRRAIQAWINRRLRRTQRRVRGRAARAGAEIEEEARRERYSGVSGGFRRSVERDVETTRRAAGWVGGLFRAGGGRLGGRGLHDTVPVPGGMAAPGELVVNRHTEQKVNAMLGRHGRTLEGMTDAETRKHSEEPTGVRGGILAGLTHGGRTFAAGGRQNAAAARVLAEANRMSAMNSKYVYGGGHVTPAPAEPPWDCSASVSRLLQVGGLGVPTMVSGNMMNIGQPGKGWFTIYASPGHVYSTIGGRAWGTSYSRPNGGPGWFAGGPRSGFAVRHIPQFGRGAAGGATAAAGGGPGAGPAAPPPRVMTGGILGSSTAQLFGLAGIQIPGAGAAPGGGPRRRGGRGRGGGRGGGAEPASGSTRQIGRRMMLQAGWGAAQWPALDTLWTGESGWRTTADNPSSDAYGIPQSLPGSKMASKGADWRTNPRTQIAWGLDYIRGRYGSPSAALSAWRGRSPHWYAGGGRMRWGGWHQMGLDRTFDTPTMIGVGEGGAERVKVTPKGKPGVGGGSPVTITANFNINGGEPGRVRKEVEAAMMSFAQRLEHLGYTGGED
jgi:hypothetical protein